MKLSSPAILISLFFLAACANPINRATSDNYAETCSVAESNGRLDVAEEACYRALVNVDWGNLGPELKSQKLYNFARIKRRLSKFSEAEALLKESLQIEEKLAAPSRLRIGRRLVELSTNLAGENKWAEGAPFLDRASTMTDQFSQQERAFMAEILALYGKHLRSVNEIALADRFEAKAAALR